MARGRKEVTRRMIGYDLFRLTQPEINNRLDVAFYPDRRYPMDYSDFELFCVHILFKLKQHKLMDDFNMNIMILSEKRTMTKEDRKKFNTSDDILKAELTNGKDRAICALKAYYENKL